MEQLRVKPTISHTTLRDPRLVCSSSADLPPGSAGSRLRAGRPGDKHLAVVSCVKSPLLSCIPQGAFLLLSEDVALPQEEEGTSCYWMCGLRLSGIFSMPRSQLWELGMRLRFPGLGQPRVRQFRNTGAQEVGRQK